MLRVGFKLSVLTIKKEGHKDTLESVGYVYYFDCGDGITGVCKCSNSSNCVHWVCAVLCILFIPQ